jgi:Putative peptidoglycan binding domain.
MTTKTKARFAGFAAAAALTVGALGASAATSAELQAQINLLMAQLAALQGPTVIVTTTFTTNLTIGSQSGQVVALQTFLVQKGYLVMPVGVPMGYFGGLTRAAVARFQAANGIVPAVGYFGPITRGVVNAMLMTPGPVVVVIPGCGSGALFSSLTGQSCSGTPSTSPSAPLAGTDGSISDVTELGSFNNEEVSEGNSAVKVLGADIEASNDGDIALKSIKVSFDSTGNTGSDNLDDYIDSVSVWLGSTKIGSADVSDFSEDSNNLWTKSIALNGAIIREGDVAKLYIAVDAANTIDTGDISGDSWTVDIENIRFLDGSGVYTTDDSTGDINGMDVPISFVTFSTSANTELKISTASDSPSAGIVVADSSSDTNDVSLLKGKLKLEGTSDVVLDSFPVTFTAGSSTLSTINGVDDVTASVTLKLGSETYTETMTLTTGTLTGTVTFDNLNFDINAGDTVNFEVLADVNNISAPFVAGDTLTASVTASNRNLMDVENEQGDQLSDSTEKSGTATGEAQEFRTSGLALSLVSVSAVPTAGPSANDDVGTFTIKFKVTAVGDNVYVSSLANATLAGVLTSGYTSANVDRAGTATVGGTSVVLANVTDTSLTSVGNYLIEEGASETFELTTAVQLPAAGAAGLFRTALAGVSWSTSDVYPVANSYTSNLDAFKTAYISLN